MPTPIYAWFTGETQGAIEGYGSWPGEDDQAGRDGSSIVYSLDHNITIPTNPQTGLPSGQRVHGPVKMIKRIDKASPKLYQALVTGEHFSQVEIKWYRTDVAGGGGQVHYFTTLLENALLVKMQAHFPHTTDKDVEHYPHSEDLYFTYNTITWTWEDGGVTSTDSWTQPDAS